MKMLLKNWMTRVNAAISLLKGNYIVRAGYYTGTSNGNGVVLLKSMTPGTGEPTWNDSRYLVLSAICVSRNDSIIELGFNTGAQGQWLKLCNYDGTKVASTQFTALVYFVDINGTS